MPPLNYEAQQNTLKKNASVGQYKDCLDFNKILILRRN